MTIIIKKEFPKDNFIIFKGAVNVQDRLIFQPPKQPQTEAIGLPEPPETEVTVTGVQDQPGLMKGYKVISWSANGKAE